MKPSPQMRSVFWALENQGYVYRGLQTFINPDQRQNFITVAIWTHPTKKSRATWDDGKACAVWERCEP